MLRRWRAWRSCSIVRLRSQPGSETLLEVRAATARKVELTRDLAPYLAFKTLASGMVAEAQRQK